MTSFVYLDIESTVSPEGEASPWIKGNKPYLIGAALNGGTPTVMGNLFTLAGEVESPIILSPFKVLVGHNIKFDLAHLLQYPKMVQVRIPTSSGSVTVPLLQYIRDHAVIWDTSFAEYLISGQSCKFPSLANVAAARAISLEKSLDLSEELPKHEFDISRIEGLADYCCKDVVITRAVAQAQLELPHVKANIHWYLAMMQAELATLEIESNGMHIDLGVYKDKAVAVQDEIVKVQLSIRILLEEYLGRASPLPALINLESPKQLSAVFFGGEIEETEKVPDGVFASGKRIGQPKFKNKKTTHTLAPVLVADERVPLRKGDTSWSVSDQILELIEDQELLPCGGATVGILWASSMAKLLRNFREYQKLEGTYIANLIKYAHPDPSGAFLIHPQINLTTTSTGRTSSSRPNMQNNPTNDPVNVRQIFTSRWGAHGEMLEIDFKQVEILALAHLSQDKQLIDDIVTGRDIHEETGRIPFSGVMTKKERRQVKGINFGLIYGGSAKTLSKQVGVSLALCAACIQAFKDRYPGTITYFNQYFNQVQSTLARFGLTVGYDLEHGMTKKACVMESVTGRRYVYEEQWSDYSHGLVAPYTQARNYPIQGLATADLVLNTIGVMWRKILPKYEKEILFCGLIHDSVVFDCQKQRTDEFINELVALLKNAGNELNTVCPELKWTLPIKVDISRGNSLGDMVESN